MKISIIFLSFCLLLGNSAAWAQAPIPFIGAEVRIKADRQIVVTNTIRFTLRKPVKGSVISFPLFFKRLAPEKNFWSPKYEVKSLLRSYNDGPLNSAPFSVKKGVSANIYWFDDPERTLEPGNYTYVFQYEMSAGVVEKPDGEYVRIQIPGIWKAPVEMSSLEIIPPSLGQLSATQIKSYFYGHDAADGKLVQIPWTNQGDRLSSGGLAKVLANETYEIDVGLPVGTFDGVKK